ncbi:MAG TPA: hypothetical protein EYP33_06360 [Pyrodictium sp.]|nr:hypothetical protein [Pyrodictium sp.]
MPRVYLYFREHLHAELLRLTREKGMGADDVLRWLLESYIRGELVPAEDCRRGAREEIEELRRRLERLEDTVHLLVKTPNKHRKR